MTIEDIPANDRVERLAASAGQTVFTFDFPVYAATDLMVTRLRGGAETLLALSTDYTVTGAGQQAGGTITLTAAALAGDILTIESAMPTSRAGAFSDGGPLQDEVLETEFNRMLILLQQQQRQIARAVRVPSTDASQPLLPAAAARANKLAGWDSAGNWTAYVADDSSATTVTIAGGTISLALAELLGFVANVRSFGAVGNGSTDDTTAINLAAATGRPVYFPKPLVSYHCAGQLVLGQFSGQRFFSDSGHQVTINLAYNGGSHQVLIGPLATRVFDIEFEGLRFTQDNAATNIMFSVRNVRRVRYLDTAFGNVRSLLTWGDVAAAEAAYILTFERTDLTCRATHVDLITVANTTGQLEIINSFWEGAYATNTIMFRCDSNAAVRLDHIVVLGGYLGRFDRGFYFLNERVVNVQIDAVRADEFDRWFFDVVANSGTDGGCEDVHARSVTFGNGSNPIANGFHFENAAGAFMSGISIEGCVSSHIDRPIVHIETGGPGAVSDVSIKDVTAQIVTNVAGACPAAVVIGAAVTRLRIDHVHAEGGGTNNPDYAVSVLGTSSDVHIGTVTGNNLNVGAVDAASATAKSRRHDTIRNGSRAGVHLIGPFAAANVADGVTTDLAIYAAGGVLAGVRHYAIRQGRVLGLSVSAVSNPVGGSLAFNAVVNGVAVGTTVTLNSGSGSSAVLEFTTPILYAAGRGLGAQVVATASNPANNDVAVWLLIEDM